MAGERPRARRPNPGSQLPPGHLRRASSGVRGRGQEGPRHLSPKGQKSLADPNFADPNFEGQSSGLARDAASALAPVATLGDMVRHIRHDSASQLRHGAIIADGRSA